jgi:Dyp-type peroxidase family
MNPDGTPVAALDAKTKELEAIWLRTGGIRLLEGHNPKGRPKQAYQELTAIMETVDGKISPSPKEHFGFTDAIGDPIFEGQYPGEYEQVVAVGQGAVDGAGKWRPLATGEFVLGYPDEAQEIAGAAMPLDFSRNGTFLAYRKLHQNVVAFRNFMKETAAHYGAVAGIENPDDALETLMAKMAGRWSDGVPLSLAPTAADWKAFDRRNLRNYVDFTFADDPVGTKCPITSHMRRVNTRDGLGPTTGSGSVLTNRRRILRRGLPYGDASEGVSDADEHGIIMLVVCASLFRQFEFVQQQWINYGLDAQAGSDTCPIVGNHSTGNHVQGPKAKFVIPTESSSGRPPFVVEGIPQFVDTRGGEYFFVPSMTALRMIGMGVIDPT